MENRRMENPKELVRKSRASWWEDGLTEMIGGKGLILIALLGLFKDMTSGGAQKILSIFFVLSVFGVAFGGQWLIRYLKSLLVWPLRGYSIPQKEGWGLRSLLPLAVIIIILLGSFLLNWDRIIASLSGIFILLIYAGVGHFSGLKRFYLAGTVGLLSGILLSILGVPSPRSIYFLLGITGVVSTLSGIIVFLKFRRGLEVSHE
jgi:hypothetical protein